MKERYDTKHQPLTLAVGDLAYIRLHRGYNVPSKVHHKFGDQRAGPFKVTAVHSNAYELALPPAWGIHPVISIEHLEPHPAIDDDPYSRQFATELTEPSDQQDGDWHQMIRIVDTRNHGRGRKLQYLLRRKNLGPAWDIWRTADEVRIHVK